MSLITTASFCLVSVSNKIKLDKTLTTDSQDLLLRVGYELVADFRVLVLCFESTSLKVPILSPRSVRDNFPSLFFLMANICSPQKSDRISKINWI